MAAKRVSVLKETRGGERRVIVTPPDLIAFRDAGFDILVEGGAGHGAGRDDAEYEAYGATIVSTDEAWTGSDYVVKYKAPGVEEWPRLRPGMHIAAAMHAEGNAELVSALVASGATAYAYEFFQAPNGIYPLAVPDSETSGKLAVLYGAYHLQSHLGGRGVLLASTPGVKPPRVLVIGHGNVGGAAARTAVALGAEVVVLGTNRERLRRFQGSLPMATCLLNSREVLARELPTVDLVVGAILISTYDTEPMLDESLVRTMQPGSMIVDVTVGYGAGYLPTFDRRTTHEDPVYVRHGVLHCKIDPLPASVPVSASQAVGDLTTPYLIDLGRAVYGERFDPTSWAGRIVADGQVVHPELERHIAMRAAGLGGVQG